MKILKTSDITTSIAMPVKKGTLDHIQAAYKEGMDAIVKSIMDIVGLSYSSSNFYILNGCVNSGTGSDYNISAGAIFYNGEIYLVDATTFTAAGGETCVGTITTTYFAADEADPVTFTDGILRNVHEIRKIVFASGASGSGDVDFADLVLVSPRWETVTSTTGEYLDPAVGSISDRFVNLIKVGKMVTVNFNYYISATSTTGFIMQSMVLPYPVIGGKAYYGSCIIEKPEVVDPPNPYQLPVFDQVGYAYLSSTNKIYMATYASTSLTPPVDLRVFGQIVYETT